MTALTRQQAKKLARHSKILADWMIVRDFANQIYGEGKASNVEFETEGQYNDEGGTNYYIQSIDAYDVKGSELSPDYMLPFFQTEAWKEAIECSDEDENFIATLKEMYITKEEEKIYVQIGDLPADAYGNTFDLTKEPELDLDWLVCIQ